MATCIIIVWFGEEQWETRYHSFSEADEFIEMVNSFGLIHYDTGKEYHMRSVDIMPQPEDSGNPDVEVHVYMEEL